PHEICDFAGTPGGAEAGVASCARSVTHLRDALPRVLVGSLAPAADAANMLRSSMTGRSVPAATPQLGGVPGFRHLLPDEAEALREAQESLLEEMRRWGYRHVVTPVGEGIDVLERGLNDEPRPRVVRFRDAPG